MRAVGILAFAMGSITIAPATADTMDIGYIGLRGSYVFADDQSTTGPVIADQRTFDDGWGASGFIGFIIDDALRAEIEGGYRINDIDTAKVTFNTYLPISEGETFPVDGQVDLGMVMANLYYDIHLDGVPVLPWLGVGIGGAYVNYQFTYDYGDPVFPHQAKDSDWQFAYQLLAGFTVPVAESVSVSLGYRYFATEDLTFQDIDGFEFQTELTNHSVDFGMQFHL